MRRSSPTHTAFETSIAPLDSVGMLRVFKRFSETLALLAAPPGLSASDHPEVRFGFSRLRMCPMLVGAPRPIPIGLQVAVTLRCYCEAVSR
jgi:hypothetical protein